MKQFLWRLLKYSFAFTITLPIAFILTHEFVSFDFKKNLRVKTFGYLKARLADLDTINDVDLVVLGSSHAYRAIDPRNFKKYRVFTLASSAQTPLQTEFFIKNYVKKAEPELVLWEVYNKTFSGNGLESSIDLAANINLDERALLFLLKQKELRVYLSLLINWYDNDPAITGDEEGNNKYVPGGFVERVGKKYYSHKMLKKIAPLRFHFNEQQISAFENGIRILNDMGVEVFLFRAPVTKPFYRHYINQREIDSYFKGVVQKYNLSGYINFNEADLNFVDTVHFYDANHLNQKGANKLDMVIRDIIHQLMSEKNPMFVKR